MPQKHTVAEGEDWIAIAQKYGFRDPERIALDEGNTALREKKVNLGYLYAGDEVSIPDKEVKDFRCEVNKTHHFVVKAYKRWVRMQLADEAGAPHADVAFEVRASDGRAWAGRTDASGLLAQAVPAALEEVTLSIWLEGQGQPPITSKVQLVESMDPPTSVKGAQKRLRNLAFYDGPLDGAASDAFKKALSSFQASLGHDAPTGELDEETAKVLEHVHDQAR